KGGKQMEQTIKKERKKRRRMKRQTEIENKRRQLEDDRRQLQHLKSKALREKWLLEGAPSSASVEDEAMKKQMQEDEVKTKENVWLERELEAIDEGRKEGPPKVGASPGKELVSIWGSKILSLSSPKAEKKISNSPMKLMEGTDVMKAAMYSVEITVEKDRITGETKVLSSTTLLPKDHCLQGVKVYEDEMKVVHAVHMEDGAIENGVHPLSSSEVDELIHKADEVNLSEVAERDSKTQEHEEAKKGGSKSNLSTPRKEITGVQAKPMESPKILASGEGVEPSKEQPVTMIFMGYQNVEDENETKKVLGLGGTIKAELVVIEDAENKPHAPPNGSTVEPVTALPQEGSQVGETPGANDTDPKGAEQDLDMKKHRCKCCTVM
uniref:Paralemmin-1 n=1 Tax=Pelusios castaneus TaxID=367368 RepID=A0A8C8VHL2_9SAUR